MDLQHKTYPDDIMKNIEVQEDVKYAVSTLGLWSLRKAYDQGSFKVRSSDMEKLVEQGEMQTTLASHVETNYNFSQDEKLRERYSRSAATSSSDQTYLRYGKIIEELDAMAGDCSYKYMLKNLDEDNFNPDKRDFSLVTVSVDRIDFMNKLEADKDMRLSGYMLMAKGSTLMVKIDVLQRDCPDSEWTAKGDAIIVFVARGKNGKAYPVPELTASRYDHLMTFQ